MNTKVIHFPKYKNIFFILASVSLLSLVFYVVEVNKTVRNVVEREAMEAELTHLTAEIGEKEFAYIALKNKVSLEMAYELGFKQSETNIFVSRGSSVTLADAGNSVR